MIDYVTIPEDEFLREVNELLDYAQKENVTMKALGALGIYLSLQTMPDILVKYKSLGRMGYDKPMFTDLDVVSLSKDLKQVRDLFEKKLNYKPDQYVNTLYGNSRNIYYHPNGHFHVDVFYDALRYSHDVNFTADRLNNSNKTILPGDFALEKLQIHQINRKDLVDLFMLFLTHGVAKGKETGKIDALYVANILADDWGFWYDATENLKKVISVEEAFLKEGKITQGDYDVATSRIFEFLNEINEAPKTRAWEKRARKGTSKLWYKEVDEVER